MNSNTQQNTTDEELLFNMVKISGIPIPLACRTNTYSDKWLIGTIFQDEEQATVN